MAIVYSSNNYIRSTNNNCPQQLGSKLQDSVCSTLTVHQISPYAHLFVAMQWAALNSLPDWHYTSVSFVRKRAQRACRAEMCALFDDLAWFCDHFGGGMSVITRCMVQLRLGRYGRLLEYDKANRKQPTSEHADLSELDLLLDADWT